MLTPRSLTPRSLTHRQTLPKAQKSRGPSFLLLDRLSGLGVFFLFSDAFPEFAPAVDYRTYGDGRVDTTNLHGHVSDDIPGLGSKNGLM